MDNSQKEIWSLLKEFRDLWELRGLENFNIENANHIAAEGLEVLRHKVNKLEQEITPQINGTTNRKEISLLRRTQK